MTLITCSHGHKITTKSAQNVQRADYSMYKLYIKKLIQFDCPICGTTLSIARKSVVAKNATHNKKRKNRKYVNN